MNEQFEHKDMTGTMFKNKYKTADNHPNAKGKIKIEGKLYEIASWLKQTKDGETYSFLVVSEPYIKEETTEPDTSEPDNDMPF